LGFAACTSWRRQLFCVLCASSWLICLEDFIMTDMVTYAVQGHLGLITLNNPPVNALSVSKGVLQRILDAIKEGEHDPNVRAFLVHGSGRAFSGGADISEFGKPYPVGMATLPALASYMDT